MKKRANGIDIEVEDSGAGLDAQGRPRPVVLLIMGLGMQLIAWPPAMVHALLDAGYRVVRFDNRDVGLSQQFDALGKPKMLWTGLKYRLGWRIKPPYSRQAMALDALGGLEALQMDKAQGVGGGLGGASGRTRGVLAFPATRWARCPTLDWAASGALGMPGRLDWSPQPAERSSYRAEYSWQGPIGTPEKVASVLSRWDRIRFEITEEPTSFSEGSRIS